MRLTSARPVPARRPAPAGAGWPAARPTGRPARAAIAALGALALGCVGGGCTRAADATATAQPGLTVPTTASVVQHSIVTMDVATVNDCKVLAAALLPLFDSLDGLSAEEANRLDQRVIDDIGDNLQAIETKRKAMNCDEAAWKRDSCAVMAGDDHAMAQRFLDTQCSDQ